MTTGHGYSRRRARHRSGSRSTGIGGRTRMRRRSVARLRTRHRLSLLASDACLRASSACHWLSGGLVRVATAQSLPRGQRSCPPPATAADPLARVACVFRRMKTPTRSTLATSMTSRGSTTRETRTFTPTATTKVRSAVAHACRGRLHPASPALPAHRVRQPACARSLTLV